MATVKQTAKIGQGKPGPGRPKGKPNKTTQAIKDAVTEAFQKAGGVDYLVKVAEEDPKTFLNIVGKVIPLQVNAAIASTTLTKEQRDAAVAAFLRANG